MELNHQAPRAAKARLAQRFTSVLRAALVVATALLLSGGVALLVLDWSLGWLLIGLAIVPACVLEWYQLDLLSLPVGPTESIDDRLEGAMLAHLPSAPSPQALALAAMRTPSGQFFAGRFGIAPDFLSQLSSTDPALTAAVWTDAAQLSAPYGRTISAASVVAALVRSQPQMQALLPHLQIDENDVAQGVAWYARLQQLIDDGQKPRLSGGIARDWTFGYTPLLERYGLNLSQQVSGGMMHVHLDSHRAALDYMLDAFSHAGRQNAALIGPLGAGKTTLLYALADLLIRGDSKIPNNLRYQQIVSLNASSLISAAQNRNQLEQLVNQLLVEAFEAKNIILCLDDAQVFFEETAGAVDLSSLLLPILEGGRLRLILAMDEQSWLRISARSPALTAALNRISIAPATVQETYNVMQDQLITIEFSRKVSYMYQALKEAYRLAQRYQYDVAMPGAAVRLLEMAASYAESGVVTAKSVQQSIESTTGVKVGNAASDDTERERLLNMEDLIHQRMINQTRAVQVVSDALRRARAGVRNEKRAIGTFLFLGPTGVGKTELAKSLAAVYFNDESRLIRVDLNEFSLPEDAGRLIATGAEAEHSLIGQVMKQPFSVILLDEIEKAHPQVLSVLLQVLDEGILRDASNREISFRDTIIIATSNAGADEIRQRIEAGQAVEQFEAEIQNALITSHQFRPEFLNRFDEIVVFRPLTQEELLRVVDLILAGINSTLAVQKITVTVDDDAKRRLVELGYDPRLGARPIRRAVQRTVESLVARRVLTGEVVAGGTIQITLNDIPASAA